MEQAEVIAGLKEERERLGEYLRGLDPGAWEKDSLCEGWRVRDVVAHLTGNCADILSQNLEGVGSPAYNQRQVDERASLAPEAILAEWDQAGPGCEAIYEAMPPELWAMEMPGIIGTIGWGVRRQLEDLWVHAQDIRIGLGDDPSAGTGLLATLDVVARELPLLLERHAGSVGTLELRLAGFERTIAGQGSQAVVISGDPVAFALVATGRRSLDAAVAEGRLHIEPELPERALQIYGAEFTERL